MMTDFAAEREAMVQRQLKARGISSPDILDAFREVPRELFVGAPLRYLAHGDHPLRIEAGQTISQPYIVALMMEAAKVKSGDRVLEVGAGSGYAAAVISRVARSVTAIERQPELAALARERMRRLGYGNVEIVEGDGSLGWPPAAPYDSILVAASGRLIPKPLLDQLAPGGCIVMPLGGPDSIQRLVKARRAGDGRVEESSLGPVRFVPLIGEEGWRSTDAGR